MEKPEILKIREYIALGDIESSLKVLLSIKVDSIIENEIRTLSANFHNINKEYHSGSINNDEKNRVHSKVIQGVLSITDKIITYSHDGSTKKNDLVRGDLEKADECYLLSKEGIENGYIERDVLKYLHLANRYYKLAIENDPSNSFLYLRLANTLKTIYFSPEYHDKEGGLYFEIDKNIQLGRERDKSRVYHMEFNQIQNDLDKFSSIKRRPILLGIVVIIALIGSFFHEKIHPLPEWILVIGGIPIVMYIFSSMNLLFEAKDKIITSMRRG